MQFLELKTKIQNLKGIHGLLASEDLMINNKLEIYMKRREKLYKAHCKADERVLIYAIPMDKIKRQIAQDAILTVCAMENVPVNEENLVKFTKEIKDQIHQNNLYLIRDIIDSFTEIYYIQALNGLGLKNVSTILNPTHIS